MIDFGKILKRAWKILWDYRTLWIFGILIALTTTGGGNFNFRNSRPMDTGMPGQRWDVESLPPALRQLVGWFEQDVLPLLTHPEEHITTLIWIAVVVLSLVLLIGILRTIVQYVAQAATMRMVDEYEQGRGKIGFRQGWRLGWNRRAFRLWLIDLLVFLSPVLIFLLSLVGLIVVLAALTPSQPSNEAATGILIALSVGVILLMVFIFFVVMAFLGLLREFFGRAAVLDGLGTMDSLQHGWVLFKRQWKNAGLMWLITFGLRIGMTVGSLFAFFLLIPLYLLLLLPAAIVAAIPAAIAFGIASLFTGAPLSWIIALLVALPFFFTVLFSPLILIESLYQVYLSSVWTLTYRELKALEAISPDSPVKSETFDN